MITSGIQLTLYNWRAILGERLFSCIQKTLSSNLRFMSLTTFTDCGPLFHFSCTYALLLIIYVYKKYYEFAFYFFQKYVHWGRMITLKYAYCFYSEITLATYLHTGRMFSLRHTYCFYNEIKLATHLHMFLVLQCHLFHWFHFIYNVIHFHWRKDKNFNLFFNENLVERST